VKLLARSSAILMLPVVLAGALVAAPAVRADDMAKPSGYKDEMINSLRDAESKLSDLAEAMPQEKYTWRPGEGVRSPAEVFLHVAAANYQIPSNWGVKPPEGFEYDGYEQSLTRKADIEKALKDSYTHLIAALQNTSDEDMQKSVTLFGQTMTVRAGYLLMVSHAHEHLGQSIAYARVNGVVPPWTARQRAAEKEKAEKEKEREEKKNK
jgi:uncharacterized damage-inducible protein DinB